MPIIRVPETARPALQRLAALDGQTAASLIGAIESAPPALRREALAQHVESRVQNLSRDELDDIIDTLFSLATVQLALKFTPEDLATELAESEDLDIPLEHQQDAATRFIRILRSRPLSIAAKTLDLLTEYERSLHEARILTDVRPIFLDDPSAGPVAAAIVHTLRLRYHHEDETRSVSVAMTPKQIAKLRELLDRAEAKARALAPLIEAANIPQLEGAEE